MKQIKGLDTLRAFAVFFVIITHWFPVFFLNKPVLKFIKDFFIPDGAAGVNIFFTLSGFLITSILLNARYNSADSDRFRIAKSFFVRRALRIFPLYYLFISILLIGNFYPDIRAHAGWFLSYATNILCFVKNSFNSASHTWTLAVEEQFYLCWPWIILFIDRKYLKWVFGLSIIVGIVSTYIVTETLQRGEPFLVFNCIDAFGIGGLYAYIRQDGKYLQQFEKAITRLSPVLLLIYFGWKAEIIFLNTVHLIFLKKTVESILALWLIILIINNKSKMAAKYLLENKPLNFIGKISYGIYLVHPYIVLINAPLIITLNSIQPTGTLNKILTGNPFIYSADFGILIFICWLSYHFFELPLMSLKKHFEYT